MRRGYPMAQPSSDGELLARYVTSGDRAAFTEIVRRHGSMVARVCRQITANDHDAEDAAQLVFATLATRADGLKDRCSIAGWLHTTAWNVATRARRDRRVRRQFERAAAIEVKDYVLSNADVDELSAEVHRALKFLIEEYREPVILHHLEGLTVEEVAQRLGCPVGTAASRLSRGRALLRSKLADCGMMPAGLIAALWAQSDEAVPIPRPGRIPPPPFFNASEFLSAAARPYAGAGQLGAATVGWTRIKLAVAML